MLKKKKKITKTWNLEAFFAGESRVTSETVQQSPTLLRLNTDMRSQSYLLRENKNIDFHKNMNLYAYDEPVFMRPKHECNTNVLEVISAWTGHGTFPHWNTTQQYKGTDC